MNAHQKAQWRVGRREGQKLWQVKQAPGWSVRFQGEFKECAEFLIKQGVDIRLVPVLTANNWKTLGEWIAIGTEPESQAPAIPRQGSDKDRGIMRPRYTGD